MSDQSDTRLKQILVQIKIITQDPFFQLFRGRNSSECTSRIPNNRRCILEVKKLREWRYGKHLPEKIMMILTAYSILHEIGLNRTLLLPSTFLHIHTRTCITCIPGKHTERICSKACPSIGMYTSLQRVVREFRVHPNTCVSRMFKY